MTANAVHRRVRPSNDGDSKNTVWMREVAHRQAYEAARDARRAASPLESDPAVLLCRAEKDKRAHRHAETYPIHSRWLYTGCARPDTVCVVDRLPGEVLIVVAFEDGETRMACPDELELLDEERAE